MATFEEKIDNAVHAAFYVLGLDPHNHPALADALNDYLTENFEGVVTSDTEDE